MAAVDCPHCRKPIPRGSRVCHHCLQDPRNPPARRPPAPRKAARVHAPGARFLLVLRVLYVAYGLLLVTRSASWLREASGSAGSAAWWLGASLMPLVTLVLLMTAVVRVRRDPFLWTLVLAGLMSAQLFAHGLSESLPWLDVGVAVALWAMAFASPAVARRLAGQDGAKFQVDDHRVVAQILVVFLGIVAVLFVALRGAEEVRQLTGLSQAAMFYVGLLVVGLAAVSLDWPFALRESLRLRVDARGVGLGVAGLAVTLAFMFWWMGLYDGRWWPQAPDWTARSLRTLVLAALLPALSEEWLCRGVLWQAVSQRTGALGTVLLTAVLFAVLHVRGDPGTAAIPRQFVGGLVMGWMRLRTGSLAAPMICHAGFNALLLSLEL